MTRPTHAARPRAASAISLVQSHADPRYLSATRAWMSAIGATRSRGMGFNLQANEWGFHRTGRHTEILPG